MYKKTKILNKITLIVLSMIISSCTLENEDKPDSNLGNNSNEIIEGKTIYIVGDSYNENNEYTSCYWVNGERVELPGGYTATDIVVYNGNIYTSGTADGACYWINQQRYDLPGNGGEAEAIAVDGEDVYVAGWYNNGSCYWKNGQRIDLTVNRDSQAFAIGVRDNGSVYIGGYYMNNHHYYIPCFWKDGNNRTNLPIPNGGDGEVNDIAFEDGNMRYYSGYVLKTSSFAGYTPTAVYWRHTTRNDLPLGGATYDVYGATGHGIKIYNGEVYVAGYTDWFGDINDSLTGGTVPQYWRNGEIYDLPGGPITEYGIGAAYDIDIVEGYTVITGIATKDSSYNDSSTSACYWINENIYYLVDESLFNNGFESDWYRSNARGIFID